MLKEMETKNIFKQNGNQFSLNDEAKFFADGIASDFFILESAPNS
jgi:hypothetical protein